MIKFLKLKIYLSIGVALVLGTPSIVQADFLAQGDPKPAVIIFSQSNDGGWSQAIHEARTRLEKSMDIRIPQAEGIPETATAIRPAAELFIERGANIIIGSAFGYSDTFLELSERHPDVVFLNPAGTTNGPNLKSFYGRDRKSVV